MFLTTTAYLALAVSVILLTAIYFRMRHTGRRTVASLFLWDHEEGTPQSGRTWHLVRLPFSYYLEALSLLLLALAAAGPFLLRREDYPPVAFVLDNSLSMGALQADGRSARDTLIPEIRRQTARFRGRRVLWVLAGAVPASFSTLDFGEPGTRWDCMDAEGDLAAGIALARSLSPTGDIVVMTDAPPAFRTDESLGWYSAASSRPNVALVNARRCGARVLLEVRNYSDREARGVLSVVGNAPVALTLGPGEQRKLTPVLSDAKAALRAEIRFAGDALSADDAVILLPEERPPLSFRLLDGLDAKQRTLLESTLLRNPAFISIGRREICIGGDSIPAGEYHRLIWHTSSRAVLSREPLAFRPGFDELFRGLIWQELQWPAEPDVDMPGEPLVWMGTLPLMSLDVRGPWRDLYLNLAADAGNLPTLPFWPSFFWNLSDYLRGLRPGPLRPNLRVGETLHVRPPSGADMVLVDGQEVPVVAGLASIPGLVRGLHEVTVGGARWEVSVNALVPVESDLSVCGRHSHSPATLSADALRTREVGVSYVVMLAAAGVLCVHQLTRRRK